MEHPDNASRRSYCPAGIVPEKPDDIFSIVLTDQDDEPVGVLEKWSGGMWVWAEVDSLIEAE